MASGWRLRVAVLCAPLLGLAICAGAAPRASAQQEESNSSAYTGISVEPNPQIFAVMCALDAAGFDVDEGPLAEMPARLALREDLSKMHGPATEELRKFYREHTLAGSAETLSHFMTFALVVGPPPSFDLPPDRDSLPPDILFLEGFDRIMANFYAEAHLDKRWVAIQPEYERAAESDAARVRRIITVANGYLREIVSEGRGSTFTVYVEPLVGYRTTFRSLGNHYAIVVGSGDPLPEDDIQHAYLHFTLDPLVLKYGKEIEKKRPIFEIAAKAPRLPQEYENDIIAFTDECLIKAVELRVHKKSPAKQEAVLTEDDQDGFTLVRPMVHQLEIFEKSEPAMTYYFPDLLKGLDVPTEVARLKTVTFAPAETATSAQAVAAAKATQQDETNQLLDQGDREIALQHGDEAAAAFEKVLQKDPWQPRAMYGLAIASVLVGKADQAMQLFQSLVSASRPVGQGRPPEAPADLKIDPTILAWCHVYLGRIHDLQGDRDSALAEYKGALAVNGAEEAARAAAQHGVEGAYRPVALHGTGGSQ